jgi:SAM-dependent methyltransferase
MERDPQHSTPREFFEELYAKSKDPWAYTWASGLRNALAENFYEQRKYRRIHDVIPRKRYRNVLEIGCSIGVFSKSLGRRCENLLGIDYSPTAIAYARKRCARQKQIRFAEAKVPDDFPEGSFDLIVFTEVAYYLSLNDFEATGNKILEHLVPGGHLVMAHYRHHQGEPYPISGDFAHDWFLERGELTHLRDYRLPEAYRLDLLEKR